ncbi:putative mannan endo-1,4-beta-mannosidase 9 [Phoenix dactylifera]|uniref:mannan endo-1,4-beta-mannosidase n=1 Tax=Phoenix dactylifera TaxID=42345 RepID=A0A8B9A7P1_PHODC|nr:putative mannan endo-1,4-beta-mannosidase 9 [Phoenix dactylifera]
MKCFLSSSSSSSSSFSFARTTGTHFVVDGRPFHSNGFNAYWLMLKASDPAERGKVSTVLQQASAYGMRVVRTWAFSDGGNSPLQYSPGSYNEAMFKGLDLVIAEAKKNGVYLILSLVNNYADFGGRKQYVQWAKDKGQYLGSDDDFYSNDVVKGLYKDHVKTVLTRVNTITGVAYKDDPIIFSWELINEPRCQSDLSGKTLQAWVTEMAAYVKSIDSNHMLEVGLEGFYGESRPERKQFNPGYEVGTDFIANNMVPEIDFATIHAYPDQWISGSNEAQMAFLKSWVQSHTDDAGAFLGKPLMITEFGKCSKTSGYTVGERDALFSDVYGEIYGSARAGGPCAGGLFWQVLAPGMDNFGDGYEIIFSECPSTTSIIAQQSHRISSL